MGKWPSVLRKHGFIISLFLSVIVAFLFPWLGERQGPLHADFLGKTGIIIIFFLQGLSLPTDQLLHGFRNWRVHVFIQVWIFFLTPLVFAGGAVILQMLHQGDLAQGFLYLGLLPTTISSAVVLSTTAGGNPATAIFNTSFSNMIGVFWVPLGCLLLFSAGGFPDPQLMGSLLWKLACLILFPLLAGQLLRPFISGSKVFKATRPWFKTVNNSVIVFIVFTAFCQSFLDDSWAGIPVWALLLLGGLAAGCVLLIHALVWLSAKRYFKDVPSQISALFCSSQKTLASGVPMAVAIFDSSQLSGAINLGLLLLPLMCYHPLQLLFAAILIPKLRTVRPGESPS